MLPHHVCFPCFNTEMGKYCSCTSICILPINKEECHVPFTSPDTFHTTVPLVWAGSRIVWDSRKLRLMLLLLHCMTVKGEISRSLTLTSCLFLVLLRIWGHVVVEQRNKGKKITFPHSLTQTPFTHAPLRHVRRGGLLRVQWVVSKGEYCVPSLTHTKLWLPYHLFLRRPGVQEKYDSLSSEYQW